MEGKGAWACSRVRKRSSGRYSQRSVTFACPPAFIWTRPRSACCSRERNLPEVQELIAAAPALITSRLSLVESSRALHRLRQLGQVSEAKLADAQRELSAVWTRCELWELTRSVCERARDVA